MNKSDLVDSVSKVTALTKREAEHAVNAVFHAVMSEVRAGRRVSLVGFGSFHPTRRKARMGRNPQTGAPVKIAASKGVRFGPAGAFKDVVNGRTGLAQPTAPAKSTARKSSKKTTKSAKKAAKRAPAAKAAKRATPRAATKSTRRTVGQAPAKKAAKKAAKKTVRKAVKAARRAPVKKAAKR